MAIRSAVAQERRAWLYAGAGIVVDSEPQKEWEETGLKFRPMLEALGVMETAECPRAFYDIRDVLKMNDAGYFPYTPATTLLRGMRASIDMLLDEGLESVFARHARIASGVRAAIAAIEPEDSAGHKGGIL